MKIRSIFLVTLLCASVQLRLVASEDIDHGIDFDFSDTTDEEMIPLTPRQQGEEQVKTDEESGQPDPGSDSEGSHSIVVPEEEEHSVDPKYTEIYNVVWDFVYDQLGGLYRIMEFFDEKISAIFIQMDRKPAETNYQAFLWGFEDGILKFQTRRASNCFTDGFTYYYALYHFIQRFYWEKGRIGEQESLAYEDLLIQFFHKCTVQDSVPGTLGINSMIYFIDSMPSWLRAYFLKLRFLLKLSDLFGLFNSMAELGAIYNVGLFKYDGYNKGRFVSKLLKVMIQYEMMRQVSRHRRIYSLEDESQSDLALGL